MPFRHPDRSHDLHTRIELEVRERLEEAVDYVCLEALVRARRAAGRPAPAAGNAADKRAYTDNVLAFLRLLQRDLAADPSGADPPAEANPGTAEDEQARLVATQVALARRLPDYWQRFETVSAGYLEAVEGDAGSGRQSRGLLARLFGLR